MRNRKPRFQSIEEEIFQWMDGQEDVASIGPADIWEEGKEIASRLQVSGFKGSDTWAKAVKKRYEERKARAQGSSSAPQVDTPDPLGHHPPGEQQSDAHAAADGGAAVEKAVSDTPDRAALGGVQDSVRGEENNEKNEENQNRNRQVTRPPELHRNGGPAAFEDDQEYGTSGGVDKQRGRKRSETKERI
ncbi:unnamed protein product [Vitrella brassicaformis CCMP3155]|uniref:HTH CENPB-type domain-containing protein n=1 Tax=Vitrella brassicaformis (strain CCMP3155) TaxID=1169540 RepID=A0A0G4FQG3_VITBC|nr:unnamed protein product [Vitrella brassicaformis CCMP3155]|eukprot:CEM16680.1 unnamed protein product [Vitrella brassicaformis CCMP3155]